MYLRTMPARKGETRCLIATPHTKVAIGFGASVTRGKWL
jgi:hypothetical protein